MCDAVGDDAGLARARAGQHQERSLRMDDRVLLRGIELSQVKVCARFHEDILPYWTRRDLSPLVFPQELGIAFCDTQLEITNCDFKFCASLLSSSNIKSSGNLFMFLLTA